MSQDYFSAKLSPEDIDLRGVCYRILVHEEIPATEIFLGEKPPSNVFYAEDMYFCDINCQNCQCDHCGGRI